MSLAKKLLFVAFFFTIGKAHAINYGYIPSTAGASTGYVYTFNGSSAVWKASFGNISTITAGAGISVTNSTGPNVTIAATGSSGGTSLSTSSFATLYTSSSSISQTGIGLTPAILSVFKSSGDVSLVTASTSTGQIFVATTTAYFLWADIQSTGSGVSYQYFTIDVNGVSTGFSCQDTPSARCAFGGVKNLTAGATVAVYVSASVTGSTVNVTDAQLVVMSVGGGASSGGGGGGSGTVTQVNTGYGLTGGPITNTGTISLLPNVTNYVNVTAQYVASVTANSPLSASTVGTSGSTVTISFTGTLPASSTNYIQNLATPFTSTQTNSGFNVTTGAVTGVFTVVQPDNDTTDPPINLKTLTTTEGAANMYHSLFLNGRIPNAASNGGEWCITDSTNDLTSTVGAFSDRQNRSEVCFEPFGNPGGTAGIALRAQAEQSPNGNPIGDFYVTVGTVVSHNPLELTYSGIGPLPVQADANGILRTSKISLSSAVVGILPLVNMSPGATYYVGSTALYVASVTTNASLNETFTGTSGATVTLSVSVSSISLPSSAVGGSGSCTSCNLSYDTHGLITAAANGTGGGGGGIVSPGTFTWVNNFGISASTISVSSLTVTAQTLGIFYQSLFAAQSKLSVFGEASPFISNSTGELTPGVYFDDTSTQAVSWTFRVHNYDGRQLTADIISHSSGTANFTCWEVYTSTNFVSSALATQSQDLTTQFNVGVTTAVRINSTQLAPTLASVALSNTTVANGDMLTIKLERQTGGCGNTESTGQARMTEVDIRE